MLAGLAWVMVYYIASGTTSYPIPGIDAGNMLAKQLAFISHAEGAGLVLGARVPVILNSRSDSAMSRLASCAVAALHHAHAEERK